MLIMLRGIYILRTYFQIQRRHLATYSLPITFLTVFIQLPIFRLLYNLLPHALNSRYAKSDKLRPFYARSALVRRSKMNTVLTGTCSTRLIHSLDVLFPCISMYLCVFPMLVPAVSQVFPKVADADNSVTCQQLRTEVFFCFCTF